MCTAMRPIAQTDSAAALSEHTPVRPTERAKLCRWVHAAIGAEVYWQPRSACRITSSATGAPRSTTCLSAPK